MSYDLLVFDPDVVPADRDAFLEWFETRTEDPDPFDPSESEFSTRGLRFWFNEMLQTFPAMNGPYASADQNIDESHLTDYGLNRTNIYACFSWSLAESAYDAVMTLAQKNGIAVFDVSSPDGKIWRPDDNGMLA